MSNQNAHIDIKQQVSLEEQRKALTTNAHIAELEQQAFGYRRKAVAGAFASAACLVVAGVQAYQWYQGEYNHVEGESPLMNFGAALFGFVGGAVSMLFTHNMYENYQEVREERDHEKRKLLEENKEQIAAVDAQIAERRFLLQHQMHG